MTEQVILTPIEAINEFYRLKDKYENGYYEKYVKPILKSNKSKREKRLEYSKLPKHECINCKRNVGTVFSTRNDEQTRTKKFKAVCGDVKEPCPLDIQIEYSLRESMNKLINDGLKNIERIKLDIIKEKNDALFFNVDVVDVFEKLTKELKSTTEDTGYIIENNILRNDNPEKYNLLKEMIDEFGKGFILPFKEMIKEYNETNNELKINEAVTFYINEMIPKLKEIQLLKYNINIVEFDEKENKYKLIQLPNSIESNEFSIKEDDKVIKFVKGIRKEKKKTRKEEIEIKPKNKTRKIKPVAELVLEDEVEEIIEPDEETVKMKLENKYEDKNIVPIFEANGKIQWSNKEAQNIWDILPYTVKDILLEDKDWLVDYINTCYKLRKEGKSCQLFLPKQTKFPPKLLENGKYDFDSEVVNKLFNSFSKSYQDTLLTVYSEKDGIRNYNMLKDTLASILEKNLFFKSIQ